MTMPDLAPGAPSRVVDIDVTVLTEDAPMSGSVRFALSCDLRVPGSGKIIGRSERTVPLTGGKGEIRLPTVSSAVVDDQQDSWVILVKKSWQPEGYAIRVPAGTTRINLADLPPARPLRGREKQWALSSASVAVQTLPAGQPAGGSVALEGGTLRFALRIPEGRQGLPGPGALAADDAVAGYIASPTSKTSIALADRMGGTVSPRQWGVVGDGSTDDTAAWNAVAASAPIGATIECPPGDTYRLTGPVNLTRPITIKGGDWRPRGTGVALQVQADDVTIDGCTFTSTGWTTGDTTHRIIAAYGTATSKYRGLTIRDVAITGSAYAGIWLIWCEDTLVENTTIKNVGYAGLMSLSGRRITARGITVDTVRMDSPWVNAYGIAYSDSSNDLDGRSVDGLIEGCRIRGVPWEGIDTHSGKNLRIIGNHIEDCDSGIAVLTGGTSRDVPVHDVVVSGNTIVRGSAAQTAAAIKFLGSQGATAGPATGAITGNSIQGYAADKCIQVANVLRSAFQCSGNNKPEVPWTALSLASGWQNTGAERPEWMVDSNRVWLRGQPSKTEPTSGTTNTIGSVPVEYAPSGARMVGTTTSQYANTGNVRATTEGFIQILHESNPSHGGGFHPLTGSYPLT